MPAAAWVTLIATALIVAAIALALLRVILSLRHVHFTLGTIVAGVRAIANQTSPVPPVLTNVNANLKPVRDAVERIG